jgi:hypothetical protein
MPKDGDDKEEGGRRKRTPRNFPASTFDEPLDFARRILEFGRGQPVRRLSLFDSLGKSPESGASRQLITNANKYGLVKGGYSSESLELTPDGLLAADDEKPVREQVRAKIKLAIEDIDPFKRLYDKFVGNKLPATAALIDAAKELDVAPEAAEEAVDTFIVNLRSVGLLQTLSGAERIVTVSHLLESLPASKGGATGAAAPQTPLGASKSLVTTTTAHYETTCFYITPIGEDGSEQRRHSDLFLGSIVEPAVDPFKLSVIRADAIDKPGTITRQIIEYIMKSRLVIVDLSFHNPNVFYELAIRHMMRLPVVQIIRAANNIPFDINQVRTIVIDTTDIYSLVPKIDVYRAEIANQVRRALDDPDAVDNPITNYFPNLRVQIS